MIKIIRTIFAAKQDVFPSSVLKSLLFLVLIASGVFAGPMEAKAVTFNFGFYNEFVTTVNVNKSTYAPGEAIDVTGSMYIDSWGLQTPSRDVNLATCPGSSGYHIVGPFPYVLCGFASISINVVLPYGGMCAEYSAYERDCVSPTTGQICIYR